MPERVATAAPSVHRVLNEHLPDFLTQAGEHGGVPSFVEEALRNYLKCGVLAHGLCRLQCSSCRSNTTIPDLPTDGPAESANTWQPGQIEDARDAPEEKIDAWASRFGRTRPVIALLGHNASAEVADYVTPYGVLSQADVAEVISVSTGPLRITGRALVIEAAVNTTQFDEQYSEGADYVIVPAIFDARMLLSCWTGSRAKRRKARRS